MKRLLFLVTLTALVAGMAPVAAADSPVNLALFSPLQITREEDAVSAFRFSLIYGVNTGVTGLDLSLVGVNHGDGLGVSWHGLGLVDGDFTGWQHGLGSITTGTFLGLQSGLVNQVGQGSSGVQLGIVNTAGEFSGFQMGFVNITEVMNSGLQIGLINIIKNKDKMKFFPIVNWRF